MTFLNKRKRYLLLCGSVKTAFVLIMLLVLNQAYTGNCRAQEPVKLSLAEAYGIALRSNHDIKSAAEDVKQGELLQRQAITVLFPQLTALAGYSRQTYRGGGEIKGSSWGINLDQTIYNGGRVWVAKRGAEYTLKAARDGLEFARQSVLMDLVSRANDLLTAEDLLKVSQKRVERVQEQLRQAQARVELGDMPRTSVLSAEVALSSVQLERVETEKQVALARKRLSTLIGTDMNIQVAIPEVFSKIESKPLEELVSRAVDDRPDLAQSRELIRIAKEQAELVRRNGHPNVDLVGSFNRYSDDNVVAPESTVGISLTWPFFQGGLVKLQTKESLSKVRQAEEAYGRQVDAIRLRVEEAQLTLKTLWAQNKLVADKLGTARENHRLAKARFDLGAADSLEVLDAEEKLAEAENLEVSYKYDTRTAQAGLLYAVGALDLSAFGQKSEQKEDVP